MISYEVIQIMKIRKIIFAHKPSGCSSPWEGETQQQQQQNACNIMRQHSRQSIASTVLVCPILAKLFTYGALK